MSKIPPQGSRVKNPRVGSSRFAAIPTLALADRRVSPAAIVALAALAGSADVDGWAFPRQATLGKMLGISRQAVSKQFKSLVAAGWLQVEYRNRSDGTQRANRYRILYDNELPAEYRKDGSEQPSEQLQVDISATSEVAPVPPHNNKPLESTLVLSAQATKTADYVFRPTVNGATFVGCYIDAYRERHGNADPLPNDVIRIGKWFKDTLAAGKPPAVLAEVARRAGSAGKPGLLRDFLSDVEAGKPSRNGYGPAPPFEPKGNPVVRKILASVEAEQDGSHRIRGALEPTNPRLPNQ